MVDLTTPMATEAAKSANAPVLFVYLDVTGDPLSAWTGQGDLALTVSGDPLLASGRTFIAAGHVSQVSDLVHSSDGSISEMTLTLLQADFTDADANDFVNDPSKWSQRGAVVWYGFVNEATGLIVANPVRLLTGRMTHVAMADGSSPSLSVKLQAKAGADGQRSSSVQLADAHQQTFYPGDKALEFIPQLVTKQLRFGTADNTSRDLAPAPTRTDNGGWTAYQ